MFVVTWRATSGAKRDAVHNSLVTSNMHAALLIDLGCQNISIMDIATGELHHAG